MNSTRIVAVAVLVSLVCPPAVSISASPPFTPHRNVTVMTYNVYLGADISRLLGVTSEEQLVAAVAAILTELQETKMPLRAAAIAAQITAAEPDIVGLQEVAQWSIGPTADTAAEQDFLQLILAAFPPNGPRYEPVMVQPNLDASISLPGQFVGLVDRDVMLARNDLPAADLKLSNLQAHTFATLLSFPNPVFGKVTIPRSWISADVKVRGKTLRFVTGHLEAFDKNVNAAQGLELLSGPAQTPLPLVMAADFNSSANGGLDVTNTYPEIINAGFSDAWATINPEIAGNTCCQLTDLSNSSSDLFERIDLVFTRSGMGVTSANLVGDEAINDENPPFWASDHAGVYAALKIPTGTR